RRRVDGVGGALINIACVAVSSPRWLHNATLGDKLLFGGQNCTSNQASNQYGLFMANLDGSDIQLLVDLATPSPSDTKAWGGSDVSPDGSKILYSLGLCHNNPPAGCNFEIYEMSLLTGITRDVTNTPAYDQDEEAPAYSPSGDRMAFQGPP